jgi:hypothetical protein
MSGPHHDRNGQACAHTRSLRRDNRRATAGRHVRPPRRPLHARLHRLKRRACGAQLRLRQWAFNGPVPYQVSVILTRPEPRARKIKPSKGTLTDQWSRDPLDESGRHRCPRFQRITVQQLEGRPNREPMSLADVKKTGGAFRCHPATALLIRGVEPNPRRVRTGASDQQSRGRRGRAHSSLSSSPPARGHPTCRIQEPTRAASRGIPSRESFRALGPQRMGPSPT